jgi:hypothetical protein
MMVDTLALLTAGMCLLCILHPLVPSGLLGSIGLGMIGMACLWATDDTVYANPQALEHAVLLMLGGLLLIFLHGRMIYLRLSGAGRPKRRASDWMELDEGQTQWPR